MSISFPKSVTGGCLCGSVRYEIEFAPDHDWKRGPHTCQCTQCRKNSGSLIYDFHTVTSSEITWTSKSTYAEYNSSPGCYRAFCRNCGSSLGWTDRRVVAGEIELAVGSIDEVFLVGKRDDVDKEGFGVGGFGIALANPAGDHFWVRNCVRDVTDLVGERGTRFWRGSKEGPVERAE